MKLPDGFDWKKYPKSEPGIYAFVLRKEVIYVGKALDVHNRLRSHVASCWFNYAFKNKEKPKFYWFFAPPKDLPKLEHEIIAYCSPCANRRTSSKPNEFSSLIYRKEKPQERLWKGKRRMKRRKVKNEPSFHGPRG